MWHILHPCQQLQPRCTVCVLLISSAVLAHAVLHATAEQAMKGVLIPLLQAFTWHSDRRVGHRDDLLCVVRRS